MREARDIAHEIWCRYCRDEHCYGCDDTARACRTGQAEALRWSMDQVLNHDKGMVVEMIQKRLEEIKAEKDADTEAAAKRAQLENPAPEGTA